MRLLGRVTHITRRSKVRFRGQTGNWHSLLGDERAVDALANILEHLTDVIEYLNAKAKGACENIRMGLEPAEIARRALRIIFLLRNPNELQRAFVSNELLNTTSDTQTYNELPTPW